MQFVVPQFIEVEAKIIGPISARQFIILLITAGVDFLFFRLTPLSFGIPVMFVITVISFALAFGKVNTQPMHYFMLNLTQTLRRPRLRLWQRTEYIERTLEKLEVVERVAYKPMVSQSRLAEMSLLVDTGGSYGSEQAGENTPSVSIGAMNTNQAAQPIPLQHIPLDRNSHS